ncbi:MAG: translation initiation factor IF-2 [bacterium]
MRVHELAKELGLTSKDLLKTLGDLGVIAKSYQSSLKDEEVKIVKDLYKKEEPKKEEPKKEEPKAKARLPYEKTHGGQAPPLAGQVEKPKVEVLPPPAPQNREVVITGKSIVLKDLSDKLGLKISDLLKSLMGKGIMATINQRIDLKVAAEIAKENGVDIRLQEEKEEYDILKISEDDKSRLELRPPVITVMGHVDHGKTKLLDSIRKTNVIDTEAGGITQHIGAYQVVVHGRKVTFLDTPGHEAFTALRARGAKVTDITILVVAADDGVKPQTVEAIDHAKAAKVPIIVAINKIDKEGANIDRVKQQLGEYGLVSEDWGGDVVMVPISAKQGKNIEQLLEMILLVADIQELKANPHRRAVGVIIEARVDRARGPIATVLIKNGTLHVGDAFAVGSIAGRVRAMFNDQGKKVIKAGPSAPVGLLGISEVPNPGDILSVYPSDREAREAAENVRDSRVDNSDSIVSLEDFSKHVKEGEKKDLNLIIKGDVSGSVEALGQSLGNLRNDKVHVNIIHAGTGAIVDSDIMLAKASSAIIIGFNVAFDVPVKVLAEREGVDTRQYNIIYQVVDDVKMAMEGMLEPEYEELVHGHATVRNLFHYSKVGVIAGSYVTDGKMVRGTSIRIFRGDQKIYEGKLESLKRFKDDAKEVEKGFECGVSIMKYEDFKEGDRIECFEIRRKTRKGM